MFCFAHLNITLTELYDREGFPHHLPVTLVIDGANFGTITLKETGINSLSQEIFFCYTRFVCFSSPLTCIRYL